jgi:uncharacterized protein (TIGR03000 family)
MSNTLMNRWGIAALTAAALALAAGPAHAQHHGGHAGAAHTGHAAVSHSTFHAAPHTAYHGSVYHGNAYHGNVYHGNAYHGNVYHANAYHSNYYRPGYGAYNNYRPYSNGYYRPYYNNYYRPYYPYYGLGLGLALGSYVPYYSSYGYGGYGYGNGYGYPTPVVVNDTTIYGSPPVDQSQALPPSDGSQQQPAADNAAHLQLQVPDGAEVIVSGVRSTQTGTTREFVSPALTPGARYTYTISVRYTDAAGRPIDDTRDINVRANDWFSVDFTRPAPTQPQAMPPATP